jgi:hypothetical protein
MDERGFEMRNYSLKGLHGEGLGGGSFTGDPDKSI